MVSSNGCLESYYGVRSLNFTLEDKSPDYIEDLNEIVTQYKVSDPSIIKIFCRYADANHGSIISRRGIFTLLSEEVPGLVIQNNLPYLLLNPSTLRDAKSKNLDEIEFTRLPREKVMYKLDKFEKLLYIIARDWNTSIGEAFAIHMVTKQIWLKSIDKEFPGYFSDTLNLKKGKKDVYIT